MAARSGRGVYRGVGADERRAGRRAQLLTAALELLGTEGWQATTVRAVCARAKLTPRYFYESFADRGQLLLAVFDEVAGEAARAVVEGVAAAPNDARAKARAAIGAFVDLVTGDPRKARVLFLEAASSEALTRRRFETLRLFSALVVEQGRAFYGIDGESGPREQMSALMLVGGLSETLLAWLDGTLRLTREQLVDHAADVFLAIGELSLMRARERD